jgi:hypothetical protein
MLLQRRQASMAAKKNARKKKSDSQPAPWHMKGKCGAGDYAFNVGPHDRTACSTTMKRRPLNGHPPGRRNWRAPVDPHVEPSQNHPLILPRCIFKTYTIVGVLYRQTVNLYRSCVGLGWLAQETTGFILVRASEEQYPTSSVELLCSRARVVCSRGYKLVRRGCRAQVPWYECSVRQLTLVTIALLSLL